MAGVGDADALMKTIADLDGRGELPDRGRGGRTDAADPHTDEGGSGRPGPLALRRLHPELGSWCCRSNVEERYATELLAAPAGASAICSRTGSRTYGSSSTPWCASPTGGTGTRPGGWSRSCSAAARKQDVLTRGSRPGERRGPRADGGRGGRNSARSPGSWWYSDGAVGKHVSNIFLKLGLTRRATGTTGGSWPSSPT
ncbi:response regulator transcription factor [Streptomyces echinatus]